MTIKPNNILYCLKLLLTFTVCAPFLAIFIYSCVQPGYLRPKVEIGGGNSTIKYIKEGDKVAVLVESKYQSELSEDVEAIFSAKSLESGLRVITRTDLDKILKELNFQYGSKITDNEAAEIGRLANVQLILLVFFDSQYCRSRLWSRMLEVGRAEVVWANRGSVDDNAECQYSIPRLAEAVAGTIPKVN